MKTLEPRTRKQRRRFVLRPFFPFLLEWKASVAWCIVLPPISVKCEWEVFVVVIVVVSLLLVWCMLTSTPGSRWSRMAGRPQWALPWEIRCAAKCAARHQAKQRKPPRLSFSPRVQPGILVMALEAQDIYFWGLDTLDSGENCWESAIAGWPERLINLPCVYFLQGYK